MTKALSYHPPSDTVTITKGVSVTYEEALDFLRQNMPMIMAEPVFTAMAQELVIQTKEYNSESAWFFTHRKRYCDPQVHLDPKNQI